MHAFVHGWRQQDSVKLKQLQGNSPLASSLGLILVAPYNVQSPTWPPAKEEMPCNWFACLTNSPLCEPISNCSGFWKWHHNRLYMDLDFCYNGRISHRNNGVCFIVMLWISLGYLPFFWWWGGVFHFTIDNHAKISFQASKILCCFEREK